MSKSICESSVAAAGDRRPWHSVYYDFDKDVFKFLVNNIINDAYGEKLRRLSEDINKNANRDYSVFEHIEYILSGNNDDNDNWIRFQRLLECLIILDQTHDVHLSNRLCLTGTNYNNAGGHEEIGCYHLDSLIQLLIDKAYTIGIIVPHSQSPVALKTPFITYLTGAGARRGNILHKLKPNESSSEIPNGIYVIRDTKSKGNAKEEVLIKTEEKIDTIASLTDSHSCKSNGNFKITDTIGGDISEIDILNLGLLYYQSYFKNLDYGGYSISIHFDTIQGPKQIACSGSFKLCITLWKNKIKLKTKVIEISSNVFSVKNICETLTKKNTADKIAIELQAFFKEHDLADDVIGIFLMNIFLIGKGYGDYGQGFTAGCAYMYKKEDGNLYPLYCNCFVETVDTFFFLICVLCLFPAIIGTVGNDWQYVISNDSQRFLNKNVIDMFNANSKIKVKGIYGITNGLINGGIHAVTLKFHDPDPYKTITNAFTEIGNGKYFAYDTELSALGLPKAEREAGIHASRPSRNSSKSKFSHRVSDAKGVTDLSASQPSRNQRISHLKPYSKAEKSSNTRLFISPSYIKKLEALMVPGGGEENEHEDIDLNRITSTLENISIDNIIKKGAKIAMAKFFSLRMIEFAHGSIASTSYFLFYENGHDIYPIFWDGKLLEDVMPGEKYPPNKVDDNNVTYDSYRKGASEVDANTFAFMVMVYVFLKQYNVFSQYTNFINMVGAIIFSKIAVNICSATEASKKYIPASEFGSKSVVASAPVFDQIYLDKIMTFEKNFTSSLRRLTATIVAELKDNMHPYYLLLSKSTSDALKELWEMTPQTTSTLDNQSLINTILRNKGGNITYFQFVENDAGEKRPRTNSELNVLKTVVCKITSICNNIEEYCNILDRILKNIRELTIIKEKLQQTINYLIKNKETEVDENRLQYMIERFTIYKIFH